jgi:DNA-directed RNA polymerase beta' subunit
MANELTPRREKIDELAREDAGRILQLLVTRSERLSRLATEGVPPVIIFNELRMFMEACLAYAAKNQRSTE